MRYEINFGGKIMGTQSTPFGVEKDPKVLEGVSGSLGPWTPAEPSHSAPPPTPKPSFSLPNPFRTDLPAGLNPYYFATEATAKTLATLLKGEARLAIQDPNAGAGIAPWEVYFSNAVPKPLTWNAAMLYGYLAGINGQGGSAVAHPDYQVPVSA
jgi:hypothetical protein